MDAAITYRKTRQGEWVAYGPAAALRAGATVTVTKRSGETKAERIASVGRPFTAGGIQMAYGYLAPAAPVTQTREEAEALLLQMATMDLGEVAREGRAAAARLRRAGHMCEACGERRAAVTATDMSGITGRACRTCAQDEGHGLSFA